MGAEQAVGILNRREIAAAEDPVGAARRGSRAPTRGEHLRVRGRERGRVRRRGDRARRHARARRLLPGGAGRAPRVPTPHPATSRCDLLDGTAACWSRACSTATRSPSRPRAARRSSARRSILSGFGRTRRMTERAAGQLPRERRGARARRQQRRGHRGACAASSSARWGALDGLLHAIAYAPPDALGGGFLETPRESALTGLSDERLLAEGARRRRSLPLLEAAPDGAGVVGLDFDAGVAWPSYDWMGVAKAALEAVARYLARDARRARECA